MQHYFPEQVKADLAKNLEATRVTLADLKAINSGKKEVKNLIPLGYFGNPAGFDIETSKSVVEEIAVDYTDLIESVMKGNYRYPESP